MYLDINHPEIQTFIKIRNLTGGDPSLKTPHVHHGICITDHFMECVENDEMFDLIGIKTQSVVKQIKARDLFSQILDTRRQTGEPFIIFIDEVNRAAKKSGYLKEGEHIYSGNLCTEIFMKTSPTKKAAKCFLGSINLDAIYKEVYNNNKDLSEIIKTIILFMNRVRLNNNYDNDDDFSLGIGLCGYEKLFRYLLLIEHVPPKNIEDQILYLIYKIRIELSSANCKIHYDFINKTPYKFFPQLTAVAPTTGVAHVLNTSYSCEPFFSNAYKDKMDCGLGTFKVESYLKEYYNPTEEQISELIDHNGSVQNLSWIKEEHKPYLLTAFEYDQTKLFKRYSEVQRIFCDQGISCNMFIKNDMTSKEFLSLHMTAWKLKLKSLYYVRNEETKFILDSSCTSCAA